jgi:5'-nucleotidase (lipoprotein e(P4) family)
LVVALVAGAGCATRSQRPPATAPSAAPDASPARLSPGLRWVRDSAEYKALAIQIYSAAAGAVERAADGRAARTWAVVADADETVLDNSQYQKDLEKGGRSHSEEAWSAWVQRREAAAVPGAREFLEKVHALGGVVAIVTNRFEAVCDETRDNLRALGMPVDVVLCRPDQGSSDKNPRFDAVAQGTAQPDLGPLEVLAFVGDNIQDFPRLSQDVRLEPETAFAPFGERFFLLPNPLYGSWERNPPR